MEKSRYAFTMLELIFVIIIVGILATISIPKLSATRDDAKISKLSYNIQTVKTEIATSIFAKGKVPKTKEEVKSASNTVIELESRGNLIFDTSDTNKIGIIFINRDSPSKERCKKMILDYNDSSNVELAITTLNSSTAICRGVNSVVQDINMTIAGNRIDY